MTPRLLEDLKAATTDLASARQKRIDAELYQRRGISNDLPFALAAEAGAFQRWLRVSDALHG